jgi:hypothetical protein
VAPTIASACAGGLTGLRPCKWKIALLHELRPDVFLGLAEVLLGRFRKIPFTCTHTASKDRVLAMVILCMVGYSIFGPANARLESALLEQPSRIFYVVPWLAALLWGLRVWKRDAERGLIFEDKPDVSLQVLDLSKIN